MTGILAIETATEACSVAVYLDGQYRQRHEITPRQQSQRLFGMLRELLPEGELCAQGVTAIAYGCGPGSFTGLRIAASAVQGLAYTAGIPAIPVSTLACQAQTALRLGVVDAGSTVLSLLDARINEVYSAVFEFDDGLAILREGPVACAPDQLAVAEGELSLHAVGTGCAMLEAFPAALRQRLDRVDQDLLPAARDLVPLALPQLARGQTQNPSQVQPVYVRDEISWKKLAEQGKPA